MSTSNFHLSRLVQLRTTRDYHSNSPQTINTHADEARRNALFFSDEDRVQYKAVCNLSRIHLDRVQRRVDREEQRKRRKREDQERNQLEERVEKSLDRVFKEAYESTGIVLDHRVKT